MVQKIIIICGPTAAGKTEVGIELARRFGGEIISSDSQQVWRGFDIGTAKASLEERAGVRHHLVDIVDPSEKFDAAMFVKMADEAISDITSRGRIPFIVGGTGMYIRMLERGLCDAPPQDKALRDELAMRIESEGIESLYDELAKVDLQSASTIHPNDRTRIIRALEIYELTGIPASQFREEHSFGERRYDALKIGLNIAREDLYRKIDARVDRMIAAGLVDEVKSLLERYDRGCQPFQAVGYKEIVACVNGEIPLDEAIRLTKRNSRRFAKRQFTWFRADTEIKWFEPADVEAIAFEVNKKLFMQAPYL